MPEISEDKPQRRRRRQASASRYEKAGKDGEGHFFQEFRSFFNFTSFDFFNMTLPVAAPVLPRLRWPQDPQGWAFFGFLLLLVFLPLPFGGNRLLPVSFFATGIGLLLVLLGISERSFAAFRLSPALRFAVWGFAAVALWAFVQTLPLAGFAEILGVPTLWAAASLLHQPIHPSLSLDPAGSREALCSFLAYGGTFWLAFRFAARRERARVLVHWLALTAVVYAGFAVLQQMWAPGTVLGFPKTEHLQDVTGTFINRNHFATFLGLGLLCLLAWVLWFFQHRPVPKGDARLKQQALAEWLATRGVWVLALLLGLGGTLLLTHSRGGVVSTTAAVLVFGGFWWARGGFAASHQKKSHKKDGADRGSGKRGLLLLWVLLPLLLLIILGMMVGGLADRLTVTDVSQSANERLGVYALTLQAIEARWLTGWGLETFNAAFPLFRDERVFLWFQAAHQDWLETLMDLGVPAGLLWFAVLIRLAASCAQGALRRRRQQEYAMLGFAACVLVGLHALVDFSLQIPAVAAWFAAILGVGVAQAYSTRERAAYGWVPVEAGGEADAAGVGAAAELTGTAGAGGGAVA